jgi:quaternary ammonium compound-resistance protein SugE
MAWIILLVSAVFEAVWATALGYSDGFSKPLPTVVFAITIVISMLGLGWAAKSIPIGTAYAVWTGLGAALTVTFAIATGDEPASVLKVLFLAGIIGAVIGLKLLPAPSTSTGSPSSSPGSSGSTGSSSSPGSASSTGSSSSTGSASSTSAPAPDRHGIESPE